MKKTLTIILLVLCLLLTAGAMADEDRIQMTSKNSNLTATTTVTRTTEDGGKIIRTTLNVQINESSTNWNDLITSEGLPDGNLKINFALTPPTGYTHYESSGEQPVDVGDEYFSGFSNSEGISGGSTIRLGVPYGRYLRDNETFTYECEPNHKYMNVRWYKSDGTYITEYITFSVTPSTGSIKVKPTYPSDNEIQPSVAGGEILSADMREDNREISYLCQPSADVTTRVMAPAGAVKCKNNVDETEWTVDSTRYITIHSDTSVTNTKHYALKWLDNDGKSVGKACAFIIQTKVKGSKPGITAITNEFTPLLSKHHASFGLNAAAQQIMKLDQINHGDWLELNITLKGEPSPIWKDLSQAGWKVEVELPRNVVAVKDSLGLPEDIYASLGKEDDFLNQFFANAESVEAKKLSSSHYVYTEGILKKMIDDGRIAVYAPYISQDDDQGMARVFLFCDQDGNIIPLEEDSNKSAYYVIVTVNNLGTLETYGVDEADIHGQLTQPTFVNFVAKPWKLQSKYAVQCGNRAYQVELTMLDENDNPVQFEENGKQVFYLPYPEGMSYESGATWTLRHYLDDNYTEYELLNVTATEYGLRFETDSLSPFVLLWDTPVEAAVSNTANLPKTGDNTPLALYATLLVLTAAAAVLLRRKIARR